MPQKDIKVIIPASNINDIVQNIQEQKDEPNGSGSITGAIGGPCNGHRSLSQVTLVVVESSEEGQMKSSPWLSQTCAVSPKWNGFTQYVMCYVLKNV